MLYFQGWAHVVCEVLQLYQPTSIGLKQHMELLHISVAVMHTLCPKDNGGVLGGSVSIYTKGITLNVVLLHSSTQTVSWATTERHHVVPLHSFAPTKFLVQQFLKDGLAGWLNSVATWDPWFDTTWFFLFGLYKELHLYGQNLRPESFGRKNNRSCWAGNKKYATVCIARSEISIGHMQGHK
jgi:hypothetical protein